MAAIETIEDIVDKLKLRVGQLGISEIRKLEIALEAKDEKEAGQIGNAEFMMAMHKCNIFVSKLDASNILKSFAANDVEMNYGDFMEQLSPPLTAEREKVVQQLFLLIQEDSDSEDAIMYDDLFSACNFKNHPDVQSGQISQNHAQEMMESAFDSIQNEKDEISLSNFLHYFRGISSGYPYNTKAFIRFIQSIWSTAFEKVNRGNFSVEEANKYVEQIEAMLAEKTRQKIKGSDNEETTLLKAFKHFDAMTHEYVDYSEFVRTLESFGVLAPEKELTMLFDKWCSTKNKLFYRPFAHQLFVKY